MQEIQSTTVTSLNELASISRRASLLIHSSCFEIEGAWQWGLDCEKIICSDVLSAFSMETEAVKALVHPEDLAGLADWLNRIRNNEIPSLRFRVILNEGRTETLAIQPPYKATETHENFFHQTVSDRSRNWTEQKAEKEIKEKSHYLQRILETSPDMVSIMEMPTRVIVYLNTDSFAVHGFNAAEMSRKSPEELLEIIHPEDRPVLATYYQSFSSASDEDVITAEYRAKNNAGEWKWFSVRGKTFQRNAAGAVTHILNVMEDITERKKAEQEVLRLTEEVKQKATDKYLSLFNSIDEGFSVVEVLFNEKSVPVDYRFLETNPAFEAQTGLHKAVGKTMRQLAPEHEENWFRIYGEVALTGVPKRFEEKAEALHRWYDVYAFRIDAPEEHHVAILFKDITERKKAEEQLKKFNATLEQQVAERTSALQESSQLLQTMLATGLIGICLHEAVYDEQGQIVDFRMRIVNKELEQLTGRLDLKDKLYAEEFPGIKKTGLFDAMVEAVRSAVPKTLEYAYYQDGFEKTFISMFAPSGRYLIATNLDITDRKKAEEEVKKNLTILQQAEDLAQMGSWEYEITTGNFTWSEGMYKLFGLRQGIKVRPEVYIDFAVEEDHSVAKRIVKDLKKGHDFEDLIRIKKLAEFRLLKIKASAVHDESGKAQRIVGVDVDITDIKAAEEKWKETQRWLEQTAQASPDAIIVYDLQKKQPGFLNNCLAGWLGTTTKELVRMGIDGRLQFIHPDDRLRMLHFLEKLKAAKDGEVLMLEYRNRRKDGTWLWIRNRSKVFQRNAAGQVTHVLSIMQDVTDEKTAEQVLIELNASLEKKNAELEEKNDEITSFAFVASHDLREPLRKIHTFSDWLLTKEASLSETGRQNLERLNSSVKRLDLLIDDILALTKVHVDSEKSKPVDLNLLLQRVKEEFAERLEKTGAVLEVETLPGLSGAENQLFYLFRNLVSNAIKFQPKGARPHIRIGAEKEGNYVKISVADNGIGIAEEHYKKIFEMFRRLHGRSEYEGTGMGLAICKKIMEKHGGKITVESREGEGATFVCWFPAALSMS